MADVGTKHEEPVIAETEKSAEKANEVADMNSNMDGVADSEKCTDTEDGTNIEINGETEDQIAPPTCEELNYLKDATVHVHAELDKMRMKREDDFKRIGEEYNDILKSIDNFREDIVWHIDNLVKKARDDVRFKQYELEGSIKFDLDILTDVIGRLEVSIKEFKNIDVDNGEQSLTIAQEAQINESQGSEFLQHLETTVGKEVMEWSLNTDITEYILNLKSIHKRKEEPKKEEIVPEGEQIEYACVPRGEYIVLALGDVTTCAIKGVCLLDDGQVVIADIDNMKLKKLSSQYSLVDTLSMSSDPWGVCSTGPKEIAVALPETKTIQFVSTENKLICSRSFEMDLECYFVTFSNEELFVACGSAFECQIRVYSLMGESLRTFTDNESGDAIFADPYHLSVSKDGARLFVADELKGLVTVDIEGQPQWEFLDSDLKGTRGVCSGIGDALFISGIYSYNIFQINDKGKKVTEVLSDAQGLDDPYGICYDSKRNRLIVTCLNANTIRVFDVCTKEEKESRLAEKEKERLEEVKEEDEEEEEKAEKEVEREVKQLVNLEQNVEEKKKEEEEEIGDEIPQEYCSRRR